MSGKKRPVREWLEQAGGYRGLLKFMYALAYRRLPEGASNRVITAEDLSAEAMFHFVRLADMDMEVYRGGFYQYACACMQKANGRRNRRKEREPGLEIPREDSAYDSGSGECCSVRVDRTMYARDPQYYAAEALRGEDRVWLLQAVELLSECREANRDVLYHLLGLDPPVDPSVPEEDRITAESVPRRYRNRLYRCRQDARDLAEKEGYRA